VREAANEARMVQVKKCKQAKSQTKRFNDTVKTQQQCTNISILLWQRVSVLLEHLEPSIQRYKVQSLHIKFDSTPTGNKQIALETLTQRGLWY